MWGYVHCDPLPVSSNWNDILCNEKKIIKESFKISRKMDSEIDKASIKKRPVENFERK